MWASKIGIKKLQKARKSIHFALKTIEYDREKSIENKWLLEEESALHVSLLSFNLSLFSNDEQTINTDSFVHEVKMESDLELNGQYKQNQLQLFTTELQNSAERSQ